MSEIGAPWYFAVLVEDVDRSVDWYRNVFGLHERGGSEAERARGLFKVGFEVPDVQVIADRVATAAGQRPDVVDFERFGIRIIQLTDPEGNIIQLSSPLEGAE